MASVICKRSDRFECWTDTVDGYRDLHGLASLDVDPSEVHDHKNGIEFVWVAGHHAVPMRAYIAEHRGGAAKRNGLERIDEFLGRCPEYT